MRSVFAFPRWFSKYPATLSFTSMVKERSDNTFLQSDILQRFSSGVAVPVSELQDLLGVGLLPNMKITFYSEACGCLPGPRRWNVAIIWIKSQALRCQILAGALKNRPASPFAKGV